MRRVVPVVASEYRVRRAAADTFVTSKERGFGITKVAASVQITLQKMPGPAPPMNAEAMFAKRKRRNRFGMPRRSRIIVEPAARTQSETAMK